LSIEATINGKAVRGKPNQTILEVARENEIDIPTLCHHPRLRNTGACRICVVDVGRKDRLEAACTMPISNGMSIQTENERVIKARRMNVELLLSQHNTDCLTCEANGNCKLQDLAYELGVEPDKTLFKAYGGKLPVDDSSPAILFDPNRCVLCERCISACNDVRNYGVLNLKNRGLNSKVISGLDQPLLESKCTTCGECIQVCPTDALKERMPRFQGRWWELNRVITTCPYCGVGCTLDLYVKDSKIIKVRGNENGPENSGSLCVKGRFGYDWVNSSERLTTPLIKRNGRFEPIDWNDALEIVATRFSEIKEKYGEHSLAGLSSSKCTNEENYLFQKFVRLCFGNNNVDNCARLCHAPSVVGLGRAFGSGAMTNSIRELTNSDVIIVTGSNTDENHPVIGMYIRQAVKNGAKLIVIDPRRIDLVGFSTLWLRQQSGTDVALLNGLMNVIISEGLYDEEFVKNRCENFEGLKGVVKKYTPEAAQKISGVPADKIRDAARLFGSAERGAIVFSMGITQHVRGTDNVLSIANLAMLTGNIGKESAGVYPLRGHNNVQGACDMGALPDVYPGYQRVNSPEINRKFERKWARKLDPKVGLTVVEMMNEAYSGRIKGMYIMGENSLLSDPNLNHTREALDRLDFLVVQDIFLTETAQMADVVLPGASFAEKDGTFTNTGRRVQRVRKAIDQPGQSKPDWMIICQLSRRMDYLMDYSSPAEIMEEIARVTPIYGGVHYDRLNGDGLQWPCPDRDHPGTKFLHKDRFARGKGLFTPVEYKPPAETPDAEYPFLLSTGRVLEQFHTGTLSRRAEVLRTLVPECLVEINPRDAHRLRIKDGDRVRITSRRGEIVAKARITERSAEGMVFVPFHFREAAANLLTNDALDPEAMIPEFKVGAVKILKA